MPAKEVRFTVAAHDQAALLELDPDQLIQRAMFALERIETPSSNRAHAELGRVRSAWVAVLKNVRTQLNPR